MLKILEYKMQQEFEKKLIDEVIRKLSHKLSENDIQFINRIFSRPLSDYSARIQQIGFCNHENVLDVGSGFGQWALALSQENQSVFALESDAVRLNFIEKCVENSNNKRITPTQGYLPKLPFDNNTFDAIFCYSVILITPWRESLKEMKRVLRPGGKIYLNANGFGWYKKLWFTGYNENKDYIPKKVAAEALMNTKLYNLGYEVSFPTQLVIEPEEMLKTMEEIGFHKIKCGHEGTLFDEERSNLKSAMPFLPGEFEGDTAVYEVIAYKKTSKEHDAF